MGGVYNLDIWGIDFCGKKIEEVKKIFSAENAHICNECVDTCTMVIRKDELKEAKDEFQKGLKVPQKIKEHLDNFVIGQDEAKKYSQ